ncbi:NfeD family protein [Thalassobacillus hwangdonensis]|uniref:NfeD family protein n=1 Tax=Thalassobacillus hwangdonensis TaxID=546108 RepID=A0ABW3L0A5_9BACI
MDLLEYDAITLVITFLGTMFLIGELLVNMRGIFGILGIGFITIFFYSYLAPSMFLIMMFVYVIGLLLIIIDGKLLNDGTLAVIGMVCMLIAVGFTAPNWVAALYSIIGVILGAAASLFFLKAFKRRDMWSKIALVDQLSSEAGYNTVTEDYRSLRNKQGTTMTDMRPVGTILIEGREYSAVTNGQWIPKDTEVQVVDIDGTKILVKKK